jgi:hypothetical protein
MPAHLPDPSGAREMIVVPVRDHDVHDLRRIEAKRADAVEHEVGGVCIRRVHQNQAVARADQVRADGLEADVVDVVKNLERLRLLSRRRQIFKYSAGGRSHGFPRHAHVIVVLGVYNRCPERDDSRSQKQAMPTHSALQAYGAL